MSESHIHKEEIVLRSERKEDDLLPFLADLKSTDAHKRDRAWAELQRRLGPVVRAVIKSQIRGQSKEIVDEIAQEVFLSAFTHIETFDRHGGGSFTAWVKKIANRRSVDYLRTKFGRYGKKPREEPLEHLVESGEVRDVLEEKETPEEMLLRFGAEDEVREVLAELPPRERETVLLTEVLELTGQEAGAILGVTPSRVSQLRKQATERLRKRGQDTRRSSIMPKAEYDALVASLRERAASVLGQALKEAA